jgi:hypothetical protein
MDWLLEMDLILDSTCKVNPVRFELGTNFPVGLIRIAKSIEVSFSRKSSFS